MLEGVKANASPAQVNVTPTIAIQNKNVNSQKPSQYPPPALILLPGPV